MFTRLKAFKFGLSGLRWRMSGVINKIVGLTIGAILTGALLSVGIMFIVEANTTGWGASQILIWGVVPLIVVVSIILLFVRYVRQ